MIFQTADLLHNDPDNFTSKRKGRSRYTRLKVKQPIRNILIHGSPFVITINAKGKLCLLRQRSILISDGVIKDVYPASDIKKVDLTKIDLIYDAEQRGGIVVTPGFINAHSHPPMYLLRGALVLMEDDLDKALAGMAELEGAMTENDFFIGSLGDLTEQQKSGITTTVSHYGVFEPIDEAARLANQRVINAISAVSNSHPENTPALIGRYARNAGQWYTTPAAAIHYVYKASPAQLKRIASIVNKHKLLFTLHIAETEKTIARCYQAHGDHPIAVLDKYKLLSKRTLLSHCVHVTAKEIRLIKLRGAAVVHLPTSNLLHNTGKFNYPLFYKMHATKQIALGTDSVVSKNRLDLLSEALQTKTMHQSKKIVPYSYLFNMITAQGARLISRPDLGRIAHGYQADIAFWKLKDRGFLPYDEDNPETLVANMITHGGRSIRDLMINGQFIISNRMHNLVDESALLSALQSSHMALRKRLRK
ncbi:MAG: amidohydrolase family protein [Patescibacteria group bacterium]